MAIYTCHQPSKQPTACQQLRVVALITIYRLFSGSWTRMYPNSWQRTRNREAASSVDEAFRALVTAKASGDEGFGAPGNPPRFLPQHLRQLVGARVQPARAVGSVELRLHAEPLSYLAQGASRWRKAQAVAKKPRAGGPDAGQTRSCRMAAEWTERTLWLGQPRPYVRRVK